MWSAWVILWSSWVLHIKIIEQRILCKFIAYTGFIQVKSGRQTAKKSHFYCVSSHQGTTKLVWERANGLNNSNVIIKWLLLQTVGIFYNF